MIVCHRYEKIAVLNIFGAIHSSLSEALKSSWEKLLTSKKKEEKEKYRRSVVCNVTWKIPELIQEHLKGDIRQVGVFFLNLSLHCLKRIKRLKSVV